MNRRITRSVALGSCLAMVLGGLALPMAGCESKAPAPTTPTKAPAKAPDKPADKPAAPTTGGEAPKESNK